MLGRDIPADDKHAAHLAFKINWTKAVRPPNVLAAPVTSHRYQLVLIPGRPLARHDVLDLGTNDVPDLGPTLTAARAQSAWVPFRPHRLPVCIVVELDEFWSPPNEHRVPRGENEPHCNSKTLGPSVRRAHGCARPVKRSRQSGPSRRRRPGSRRLYRRPYAQPYSDADRRACRQCSAPYIAELVPSSARIGPHRRHLPRTEKYRGGSKTANRWICGRDTCRRLDDVSCTRGTSAPSL
ncbi:hypothetical protein ACVWZ3_008605 [Bradyrhizobium sp. i1.3.6]